MSDANYTTTITNVWSEEDRVQEGLQKNLGTTTYRRVAPDEAGLKKGKATLIMIDQIHRVNGQVTTLSRPVPTLVFPSRNPSRYDFLAGGPMSFETTATGEGKSFAVKVSVSLVGAQGAVRAVKITAHIPTDRDGTLYAILGILPEATYFVNTTEGRIDSLKTSSFYHTDKTPGNPFEQMPMPLPFEPPAEMQEQAQKMSQRQPVTVDYHLK
jgi:hypothetical protein